MKHVFILLLASMILFTSCSQEEDIYTDRVITYDLFQSSDYPYEGIAEIKELKSGDLEILLRLNGPISEEAYHFTSHFHFGSYDEAGANIAFLLSPVDIRNLESKTILGKLSDGTSLDFESLRNFDGHIKVHLADDGPDYNTILVTGNIGSNDNTIAGFNSANISVCSPYYPE